jgi:hypothetical protein
MAGAVLPIQALAGGGIRLTGLPQRSGRAEDLGEVEFIRRQKYNPLQTGYIK